MDFTTIVSGLLIFLVLSIVIEYVVAVLTDKLPAIVTKYITANIWSLIIGILVALMFQMDVFAVFGLQTTWFVAAWVLTGILLAGGSKLWHELISKLRESRQGIET